jgi:hypothetical protein
METGREVAISYTISKEVAGADRQDEYRNMTHLRTARLQGDCTGVGCGAVQWAGHRRRRLAHSAPGGQRPAGRFTESHTSLGYEKSEAGLRCLARSLEARLTWVNVMRLVSDKAGRLSVHTPFREVPCTDSCTRQSSGAVLQTAAAQVSLCPVTCDDVRKLDLRLCRVPRMSHTLGIGDPVRCGPQGRSAIRRAPGAVIFLDQRCRISSDHPGDGTDVPPRVKVAAARGIVIALDAPDNRFPEAGLLADLRQGKTSLAAGFCQGRADGHRRAPFGCQASIATLNYARSYSRIQKSIDCN